MPKASVFSTKKIPSLSRLPKELGREDRFCDHCGTQGQHILYRVPKKFVMVYIKEHRKNLHATCLSCAHSTVLTGEEREKALASSEKT